MKFKGIELAKNTNYKLTSLEIGLTSICNFHCKYCCKYSAEGDKCISADDCIEIIKEVNSLKRIKLSGGEVLIYFDECVKLLNYCREKGIQTQINTNGSLLDRKKIKTLKNAGLNVLHFSLNFFNSKDYVRYYDCSDSMFFKIVENIKSSLNCNNLDTVVETIIFKETENKILGVHKFLTDLGVTKHEIQLGIPIGNEKWESLTNLKKLTEIIKNLIIKKDENVEVYFSCIKKNIPEEMFKKIISFTEASKNNIFFPDCIEGKSQLHLHSNGDVLICELGCPIVIGNVFRGTDLNSIHKKLPKELKEFISNHSCKKEYYPVVKNKKVNNKLKLVNSILH